MNKEEYVDEIIYHRGEKEKHEEQEKILRAELQKIMDEEGLDSLRTSNGNTASIGKATDNYSVAWKSLTAEQTDVLMAWCESNGMPPSVNAATFSAFVRSLVDSGFSQAELPEHINHYTMQKLNVRGSRNG